MKKVFFRFLLSELGCHRFQLWVEDITGCRRGVGRIGPGAVGRRIGTRTRRFGRVTIVGTSGRWEVWWGRTSLWGFYRPTGRILSRTCRSLLPAHSPSSLALLHDPAELFHLAPRHCLLISGRDSSGEHVGRPMFESRFGGKHSVFGEEWRRWCSCRWLFGVGRDGANVETWNVKSFFLKFEVE